MCCSTDGEDRHYMSCLNYKRTTPSSIFHLLETCVAFYKCGIFYKTLVNPISGSEESLFKIEPEFTVSFLVSTTANRSFKNSPIRLISTATCTCCQLPIWPNAFSYFKVWKIPKQDMLFPAKQRNYLYDFEFVLIFNYPTVVLTKFGAPL